MGGGGIFHFLTAVISVGGIVMCVITSFIHTKEVRKWHTTKILQVTSEMNHYHQMQASVNDDETTTMQQQQQQQPKEILATDISQRKRHCDKVPKNCSCEMYDDRTLGVISINSTTSDDNIPPSTCCTRHVLTTHKMGFVLSRSMPIDYNNNEAKFLTVEANFDVYRKPIEEAMKRNITTPSFSDFREVFVLRDVYSALVSGYLYHRTGRECHLDEMGEPYHSRTQGWLRKHKWTNDFLAEDKENNNNKTKSSADGGWMAMLRENHPPGKRTLCEYLADVPEEFGQKVYAMFAFRNHLRPMYEILKLRRRNRPPINDKDSSCGRVMFLCQRDFADPDRYMNTTRAVLNHLKLKEREITLPIELFGEDRSKKNGHMTEQDEDLRARLKSYVEEIDREKFDSSLMKMRELVGCTDEVPTT